MEDEKFLLHFFCILSAVVCTLAPGTAPIMERSMIMISQMGEKIETTEMTLVMV
jgi:hypothetical protein